MGQRKYPLELRERATRMTLEALADPARAKGGGQEDRRRAGGPSGGFAYVGAAGRGGPGHPPRHHHGGGREDQGAGEGGPRASAGQRDPEERLSFFRGGARPPIPMICRYVESKKDEFGARADLQDAD